MYQRLRDFAVPAAVLDEIFGKEENLEILQTAWEEMREQDLTDDEIAREISDLVYKELNLPDNLDMDRSSDFNQLDPDK